MQIEARDAFVAYDSASAEVTGPTPRLVNVIDADAHEGPVYVRDEDALYFTSVPVQSDVPLAGSCSVAIRRLQLKGTRFPRHPGDLSTVHEPANMANGMSLDGTGH